MGRAYFLSKICITSSLVLLAGIGTPPAMAENKGIGIGIGIGILNEALKGLGDSGKGHRQNSGEGTNKRRGDTKSGRESSASEPRKQEQLQTEASTNYAEEEEARRRIEQNDLAERNRNVENATARFIKALETQHIRLRGEMVNVRVSTGTNINQVTAGEVRAEVEKAYAEAHLTDFDRFAGELWTRDRLTVQILREAERGVEPYFQGVGAKGPSMTDLKDVFSKSARIVYARAFELAEIIGVSHSFDRFIRTIYENSDRVPESLWTIGADGQYERLLSRAINTIDRNYFMADGPVIASDPHGLERLFQFRFRARRALYDCLSARYANTAADRTTSEIRGALPPLAIENSISRDSVSRGTGLAAAPQPDANAIPPGKESPAAAIVSDQTAVWRRVQEQVRGECNNPMMRIADSARGKGLEPIPARWDVDGESAQPGGPLAPPQFLPANNEGAR